MIIKKYNLYTDGSCLGNPGPGGIGYVIYLETDEGFEEIYTFYRGFHQTTNNRMELKAGIDGLKRVRDLANRERYIVSWFTDSRYITDNINHVPHWKRNNLWERENGEPVLNRDYWRDIESIKNNSRTHPVWISRDENNIADSLAKRGARNPTHTDLGFNPGRVGTSVSNNRNSASILSDDFDEIRIRIYKGDGEVGNDKCKIRFQIVSDDGTVLENKFYIYTNISNYKSLHRHHIYVVEIRNTILLKILEED